MRKIVAISFLLIANLILLAHSFVPHHHHEGVPICFSSHKHSYDCDKAHSHSDCDDLFHNEDCTNPLHEDSCTDPSHNGEYPLPSNHSSDCDHHNGNCCGNDCCNISKEVYARILEDDEIFSKLSMLRCSDGGVELNFYISDVNINDLLLSGLQGLPFRQKPYQPSYFSDFIIGSFGLRGPPSNIA